VKGLLLAVMVAACGTDTIRIPISVPGRPALFSGRSNGGEWHSFAGQPQAGTTYYTIDIDGDFELAMVCTHSNRAFIAGEVFGTYDDANVTIGSWQPPDCTEPEIAVGPTIDITGVLDSVGSVAISDAARYAITGEQFVLPIAAGHHDIFVYGDYTVLIHHDVDLLTNTFVGILPVGAQGTPMLEKEFSPGAVPDEAITVITRLVTRNGARFEWANQGIDSAIFVPSGQLEADDLQTFDDQVSGYRDEWMFTPSSWKFAVEKWGPGQIIESQTQQTYPVGR